MHGEPVRLPSERKETELPLDLLSRYVGTYEFPGGAQMLVTLQDKQLYSKLASQPAIPIFPESEKLFFTKVVDAEIEFVTDKSGTVRDLILHQNGMDRTAVRK